MSGDEPPPAKRVRHGGDGEGGDAGAAAAAPPNTTAGQCALDLPPMDEPLHQPAVVSALQQLYRVYKVQYYALLEELRSSSHPQQQPAAAPAAAPGAQGLPTPPNAQGGEAAAGEQSTTQPQCSVRQTLRPGGKAAERSQGQQLAGGEGTRAEHLSPSAGPPYGDDVCGYGSDADPVPCTEAAAAAAEAAAAHPNGGPGPEQLRQWQARFKGVEGSVLQLEQVACAAALQYMDAQGALACLSGVNGCFLIRRTAVNLGRYSDATGEVDLDLALEAGAPGPAQQVSRLQAQLQLSSSGEWSLTNLGRRCIKVDGAPVRQGQACPLHQLSLVQFAAIGLLFLVNGVAVQRLLLRSQALDA